MQQMNKSSSPAAWAGCLLLPPAESQAAVAIAASGEPAPRWLRSKRRSIAGKMNPHMKFAPQALCPRGQIFVHRFTKSARPVLRPGLKLSLSCSCRCRSCRCRGCRSRSCRGSLAGRSASGRVPCGGYRSVISSAVVAPGAKQHQRANDNYRRNNSTNRSSIHSGPAIIKTSPAIR